MISDVTYEKSRAALSTAIVVDQQPGKDAAGRERLPVIDVAGTDWCPECDKGRVNHVSIVYQGAWRCRFCETQIRLAIGRDRGIVDPTHSDLYVHVVRPGEPSPRPVPDTCLRGFRGEPPWQPEWNDPEAPPRDLSWVQFSRGLSGQDAELIERRQRVGLGGGVTIDGPEAPVDFPLPEFDSVLGSSGTWVIILVAVMVLVVVFCAGAVLGGGL